MRMAIGANPSCGRSWAPSVAPTGSSRRRRMPCSGHRRRASFTRAQLRRRLVDGAQRNPRDARLVEEHVVPVDALLVGLEAKIEDEVHAAILAAFEEDRRFQE